MNKMMAGPQRRPPLRRAHQGRLRRHRRHAHLRLSELVDLVDADDRRASRSSRAPRCGARGAAARHRACYVAVLTSAGELVVHRRADWKDVYPGCWDVCFGGVLGAGEAWDDAARRELQEEAGIDARLELLGDRELGARPAPR